MVIGTFRRLQATAICIALSLTFIWSGSAQEMRVHFIDVGQGASTLVEFPCAAILIDSGGETNSEYNGDDALTKYLDGFFARRTDLKKTLHSLILSHPH